MTTTNDNLNAVVTDPVAFLAAIEAAWQAHDGEAAASGYSEDAVVIFGNGQQRSGDDLRTWPQQWFDFATDLQIKKTFRAFSGNCLASEWESTYTHPRTGTRMHERGAEFFFIRPDGKIFRHHAFEHSWAEGDNGQQGWMAV